MVLGANPWSSRGHHLVIGKHRVKGRYALYLFKPFKRRAKTRVLLQLPTMTPTFTHEFNTPVYKGKSLFSTGLYINGKFVEGSDSTTIEYVLLFSMRAAANRYVFLALSILVRTTTIVGFLVFTI